MCIFRRQESAAARISAQERIINWSLCVGGGSFVGVITGIWSHHENLGYVSGAGVLGATAVGLVAGLWNSMDYEEPATCEAQDSVGLGILQAETDEFMIPDTAPEDIMNLPFIPLR